MTNRELIDKLERDNALTDDEYTALIESHTDADSEYLFGRAVAARKKYYGNDVYMRGLIEISSYCKNDCLYCGIRRSNGHAERYRLSKDDILNCCSEGYSLGFRTFVLQGGEDAYYTDERMCDIVSSIKSQYPDCAVTLSLGERSYESYKRLFNSGADRYLLRHETASGDHYRRLHPPELSSDHRKECLFELKRIGYQVGCGFMVGSPYQTSRELAQDLIFIGQLKPHMVGIGPFIPHKDTPFAKERQGSVELTLFMLGLLRLADPKLLLPATTALGTIDPRGREKGILAGANVVMPNLSPVGVRKKYSLYDNKICTGDEAAECRACMQRRIEGIGYRLAVARGDYIDVNGKEE